MPLRQKATKAPMAVFADMQNAADTVAGIIAAHILPCTLEFLDNNTIIRVDDFTHAGLPRDAGAILLIGWMAILNRLKMTRRLLPGFLKPTRPQKYISQKMRRKRPAMGSKKAGVAGSGRARPTTVLEDATVPRSQIPAMLKAVNDIAAKI